MSTPWRRKRLFGAANNSSKAAQSQMDPDFNSLERIAAMQAALDGGKAERASSEALNRVEPSSARSTTWCRVVSSTPELKENASSDGHRDTEPQRPKST